MPLALHSLAVYTGQAIVGNIQEVQSDHAKEEKTPIVMQNRRTKQSCIELLLQHE